MAKIHDIEYAVKLASEPHQANGFDEIEFELLEKVMADTKLIEAVLWDGALWDENEDLGATILRGKLIFDAMGIPCKGYMQFRRYHESLASVEIYLSALVYLAEMGLETA